MDFNFSELNPYQSSDIVQATLAERPQRPAKKRLPLLAVVFLILDLPLVVGVTIFSWFVFSWHLRNDGPSGLPMLLMGGTLLFVMSAFFWLAAFICLKELVQYARGR